MPLYEYYCEPCNGIFEVLRPMREATEPYPCPVCDRDGKRIMPTSFSAFTFRDGMARRIPDRGTYWWLDNEVKHMNTGGNLPSTEHPELYKPEPEPAPLKGDREVLRERHEIRDHNARVVAKESDLGVVRAPDGTPAVSDTTKV